LKNNAEAESRGYGLSGTTEPAHVAIVNNNKITVDNK